MNSIRSRSSARRRLLSQRVTDSGLELEKRYDGSYHSPNEFVNPLQSNSNFGSGSTYSRNRIINPYQKQISTSTNGDCHFRHESIRSDTDSERAPLINEKEIQKVDQVESNEQERH